ncbi:BglG family transcription antiterminator [Alteribacter natronophilus]|uniref:BglG family transcription antiterminator n=1 Tax=Alteribacter natronophilus TaxID=2583810 RepID=UPI00110F4E2B|nr:BglG family transcription antiterminator [Alteribacter natronophilus]TMW72284.1 BglG family transcription antiterminator [Alteribacter natronophilus]
MILDQKSAQLLNILALKNEPVSAVELSEHLNVSRRTVYYNLNKVDDWLEHNDLGKVQRVKAVGIFLTEDTKKQLPQHVTLDQPHDYFYAPEERRAMTVFLLLTKSRKIQLKDIIETSGASRNSCLNDVKLIREQVFEFELDLTFSRSQGYTIEGNEFDIRRLFIHTAHENLDGEVVKGMMRLWEEADPQIPQNMNLVQGLMENVFPAPALKGTAGSFSPLTWYLTYCLQRSLRRCFVECFASEADSLRKSPMYENTRRLSRSIAKALNVTVPAQETDFITILLLSQRVNTDKNDISVKGLERVVYRMVVDFQRYACMEFRNYKEVQNNLLIHIEPAYYRLKYRLPAGNPLTESVKEKYSDIYQLTRKVMPHLERFTGVPVNDDETAYIAMHFGGWMRKEGHKAASRKQALIVCSSGIGTSQILRAQLETLFSTLDFEVVTSVEEATITPDLIFTTVPLKSRHLPTFHVNAVLTEAEKERILVNVNRLLNYKEVNPAHSKVKEILGAVEKHAEIHNQAQLLTEIEEILSDKPLHIKEPYKPMLNEIIQSNAIQLTEKAESWREGIRIAAKPLIDNHSITEEYVSAMIANIEENGPYVILAPQVAIPHARPEDGVEKLGMSVLKLDQPVRFSEEDRHQVSLIFILAAIDNESHLKALSQLSAMLSEEENIRILRAAADHDDIQELLNQYSE